MAAISLSLKPQLRYLSALILGVLISLGLFFLMQSLIDSGEQNKNASSEGQIMEFIRIREDETLSIKDRRKPQKPKPPKEPPPPPKLIVEKQVKPTMNKDRNTQHRFTQHRRRRTIFRQLGRQSFGRRRCLAHC